MRTRIELNKNWQFTKNTNNVCANGGESIALPHTWNATDGQDGGNDYFRGSCVYKKTLFRQDLPQYDKYYLEIKAANSSADVYLNGDMAAHHDGGYSAWRVDISDHLTDKCDIAIVVDNSPNDRVYPQMADFTFYGGLYRGVDLICVNKTHFDLDFFGGNGITVTATLENSSARVKIQTYITSREKNDLIRYCIKDKEGNTVAECTDSEEATELNIPSARLWDGTRDPYTYFASAEILRNGKILDKVTTLFGCRSFSVDPDRGFILNGKEYPLRGVSRHQDRKGIGNALTHRHHEEDIELIRELGANTVRLAHYQHDSYFYELCDKYGIVVWAEIPYISKHMKNGRENTVDQMKELITQNYNHPSICFWGLSNEITLNGDDDPDLIQNHRILNDIVKSMDSTRLTTVAAVSMCPMDAEYLRIPDLVAYNHYFGWYGGETDMNGPWFDKFHKTHPNIPIAVSEYGCEALNWHTSNPTQGDYTEEYQAHYHEELIKQLFSRKYIWATYVWNMFDFGADARAEGGENGQNHKGLVTFDRQYKKDAFYAYKAWLSKAPFVHVCGKRYADRAEDVTRVTVYSNLPEVELLVNGKPFEKQTSTDHFFYFSIPLEGETVVEAVAGEHRDTAILHRTEKPNPDYVLKEKGAILNWFDVETHEGYFSLNDKLSDILSTSEGRLWFQKLSEKLQSISSKDAAGFEINENMMQMMGSFTVLRLTSLVGMMNVSFTKEELLEMNRELNKIKKSNI